MSEQMSVPANNVPSLDCGACVTKSVTVTSRRTFLLRMRLGYFRDMEYRLPVKVRSTTYPDLHNSSATRSTS
jgi:hypothetical protein